MKSVMIDGVEYVARTEPSNWKICVIDSFVYVGRIELSDNNMIIHDAQNIIRWGTTQHLGELATKGPQKETKLGARCTVYVPTDKIKHLIDTEAKLWNKE